MITEWPTFPIKCEGGLIRNLSPIQHGLERPGSATNLINFEPSVEGGMRRINGYTKFDSAVVPSTDSDTQLLGVAFFDGDVIVPREGKIYSSSGSGWSSIATGRTQTTKQRFDIFNFNGTRKLVGVDGSNYPWTWDKTNFVNLNSTTDVQGAKHVVAFKDYLFFSKGDLVSFCAPLDETDFTSGNGAGNFRVEREVTGMIVFRERLFIFTPDSISVLTGSSSSDFTVASVSKQVGCIKDDTIQQVSGDVAFLSADGVRMLGATDRIGDFSNLTASSQIQSKMNNFNNKYETYSSTIVRDKSQYRVFGSSSSLSQLNCGGFLGTQFEPQNSLSFQWGELRNLKVFSIDSKIYDSEEWIVFTDTDDEYVYRMEKGQNFDGTAIEAVYWTPYLSLTDPLIRKTFYKADFFIDPEGDLTGTVSLSLDQGTRNRPQPSAISLSSVGKGAIWGEFDWGAATWTDGDPETRISKQLVGAGHTMSLQFEFSNDQKPFVIDSVWISYAQEDKM